VTGTGPTIAEAGREAVRLADRVVVPNARYRRDIGAKLVAGQWAELERLGLLDPE
jgi:phosphoribosylamine--glycine ligase